VPVEPYSPSCQSSFFFGVGGSGFSVGALLGVTAAVDAAAPLTNFPAGFFGDPSSSFALADAATTGALTLGAAAAEVAGSALLAGAAVAEPGAVAAVFAAVASAPLADADDAPAAAGSPFLLVMNTAAPAAPIASAATAMNIGAFEDFAAGACAGAEAAAAPGSVSFGENATPVVWSEGAAPCTFVACIGVGA
jgi:hypothetical protein